MNSSDRHNRKLIELAFESRATITPDTVDADLKAAVEASISGLEQGRLRVAQARGAAGDRSARRVYRP